MTRSPDDLLRLLPLRQPLLLALAGAAGLWACAKADVDSGGLNNTGGKGASGTGNTGNTSFAGRSGAPTPGLFPCANNQCDDFPKAPIVEAGAENAPAMFKNAPGADEGPCILEPEDGSLFPSNWLRPRVTWSGGAGPTEIRITADRQRNPLVAYTTSNSWTMPKDIWTQLAGHIRGEDITVQVRHSSGGASRVKFSIAFVEASGSMVYWAARPSEVGKDPKDVTAVNDSELRGFAVGDEATVSALKIGQVEQPSRDDGGNPRTVKCIGCHVATPDGQFVAFTDHWPWNSVIAGVKPGVTGKKLPELTEGGLAALNRPWGGMMAFSARHWFPGDKIMIVGSSLQNPMQPWITDNKAKAELLWYDLEAARPADPKFTVAGTQFGVIPRQGDPGGAASPDWSDLSDQIVYASTMGGNLDGRLERGPTDLYSVPYNNGQGGAAKPVPGASDPAWEEYYPAWSPDDRLIAFNRVPSNDKMYANPSAELFVAPANASQPIRLRANDPPACSGKKSPGVNNHWARWSPLVGQAGSATYYWLIFSSNRADIAPVPSKYVNPAMPQGSLVAVSQLYMTAVVEDEGGFKTFPAIHLWNQSTETLNTTPAWEAFQLPPVE